MKEYVFVMSVLMLSGLWAASVGAEPLATAQTAVGTVTVTVDPKAQQIIDQSKTSATPATQEEFLLAQAKTLLGQGKYQGAIDVATYILTALNQKSTGAQDIMTTAKQKLTELAKQKMSQMQQGATQANPKAKQAVDSANQVTSGVKGILGAFK